MKRRCDVQGSYGTDSHHCCLVGYYASSICGWVLRKCQYVPTKLQGMTPQKAIILIVRKLAKFMQNRLGWDCKGKFIKQNHIQFRASNGYFCITFETSLFLLKFFSSKLNSMLVLYVVVQASWNIHYWY